MIAAVLGLLLAGAPVAPKAVRPPTTAEEEAMIGEQWNSTRGREIPMPDAGTANPPFRWRISNIIQEYPIEGVQVANDVPVRLHAVVVKGRAEDVLEEIVRHFERSELYMQELTKQAQPVRQTQVTALDRFRAISYTAMVDQLANGTCMVVLGEGQLHVASAVGLARRAQGGSVPYFAPVMPQAGPPMRSDTEGYKTLSYAVKTDEAAVRAFYRESLTRLGFTEPEPDVFRASGREIRLSMRRSKGAVDVMLTERTPSLTERPAEPP